MWLRIATQLIAVYTRLGMGSSLPAWAPIPCMPSVNISNNSSWFLEGDNQQVDLQMIQKIRLGRVDKSSTCTCCQG